MGGGEGGAVIPASPSPARPSSRSVQPSSPSSASPRPPSLLSRVCSIVLESAASLLAALPFDASRCELPGLSCKSQPLSTPRPPADDRPRRVPHPGPSWPGRGPSGRERRSPGGATATTARPVPDAAECVRALSPRPIRASIRPSPRHPHKPAKPPRSLAAACNTVTRATTTTLHAIPSRVPRRRRCKHQHHACHDDDAATDEYASRAASPGAAPEKSGCPVDSTRRA